MKWENKNIVHIGIAVICYLYYPTTNISSLIESCSLFLSAVIVMEANVPAKVARNVSAKSAHLKQCAVTALLTAKKVNLMTFIIYK